LLKPGSFDACKKAVIPMIAMLDHSEVDTTISNIDIETIESNNCREMSEDNKDANIVLAMM